MLRPEELERAARIVVDCGYEIHRELGPGLLETAYEALLADGVRQAGLSVERQVSVAMSYKRVVVDNAFRIDLLVEGSLVVEVKSIERLAPAHGRQVLTYLRLMRLPLGPLDELQSGDIQRWPAAQQRRPATRNRFPNRISSALVHPKQEARTLCATLAQEG